MATRDTTWTIDGIKAEALAQNETPILTRGRELTLEFRFVEATETTTVGTKAYSTSYSFSYGGEQTQTTQSFGETYDAVLEYLSYRGNELVRRGTTDRGVPWFRERLPSAAPVASLVVPVETGAEVPDRDMWAIIIGGDDLSNPLAPHRRVELQLFVLAPLEEYADRDAVYADLGDHL